MTQLSEQNEPRNLLMGVEDVEWTPDTPVPRELLINNMRRRGIDQYRIIVPHAKHRIERRGLFGLFSKQQRTGTTIDIAGDQLKFEITARGNQAVGEITVSCSDVDAIVVRPASRSTDASLLIAYGNTNAAVESGFIEIGAGLSKKTRPSRSEQTRRGRLAGMSWARSTRIDLIPLVATRGSRLIRLLIYR